jgi:CheY-like chemotaxis protein
MTKPTKTISVLVVDPSDEWGFDIRDRLSLTGLIVHVVRSNHAALLFAKAKRIDVALVDYSLDADTGSMIEKLRRMGISCVYTVAASRESKSAAKRVCRRIIEKALATETHH